MSSKSHWKLQVHFRVGSNLLISTYAQKCTQQQKCYQNWWNIAINLVDVVILTNLAIPSKILLKLANSENAQKLVNLVEILANLAVLSRSPKSEKALQPYYGGDFRKFGNSGSFIKIAKLWRGTEQRCRKLAIIVHGFCRK